MSTKLSAIVRAQASSASRVGSTYRAPVLAARASTDAMCPACSDRMCTKLTELAFCIAPRWNRFGKPWEKKPCSVRGPRPQASSSVVPPRPCTGIVPETTPETPTSNPVAKMTQSTSCSVSPTTTPVSVMRVIPPWSAVSTRVTLSRLNACR